MGPADETAPGETFELLAGRLCLDFVNTVNWHASEHAEDLLPDYTRLVVWSAQSGALAQNQAELLLKRASLTPLAAAVVLAQAVALREALYKVFSAAAQQRQVEFAGLEVLNRSLQEMWAETELVQDEQGFDWNRTGDPGSLDAMMWAILRSAADLLTSQDLKRVRECAGAGCGWLFVDTSRNHSRRWCDMEGCGNRAKARRHYGRLKREKQPREI